MLDLGRKISNSNQTNTNLIHLFDFKEGSSVIDGQLVVLLSSLGKKEDFKLAIDELIAKGFRLSEQEYDKFLMMANKDQDKEKGTDQ